MKPFSAKQEKALAALLTESNITTAAKLANVSDVTLWRWLKDADFAAEYRRLRRDAVEQGLSQIQQATSEAVGALRRNLNCGNPTAENTAAKTILEQAIKAVEILDLQERLEKIENELEQQN